MDQVINTVVNENGAKVFLSEQGWPAGLQESIICSMKKIPIRYFIIDNSMTMSKYEDGHVIREISSKDGELVFMYA